MLDSDGCVLVVLDIEDDEVLVEERVALEELGNTLEEFELIGG